MGRNKKAPTLNTPGLFYVRLAQMKFAISPTQKQESPFVVGRFSNRARMYCFSSPEA